MIQVQTDIQIKRAAQDVFQFASDPKNELQWREVVAAEPLSPEPFGLGTRVKTKVKLLGLSAESVYQIIEMDIPKRRVIASVSGPIKWQATEVYQEIDSGMTQLSVIFQADVSGVFKFAEQIVANRFKAQIQREIRELKKILENNGSSVAKRSSLI